MGDRAVSNTLFGKRRWGAPGYVHFTNKKKLIASECQQNLSREYIPFSNATCSRTVPLRITARIKEHLCTALLHFVLPLFALQDEFVFLIALTAKLLVLIARHSHFSPSSPHITAMQSSTQLSRFPAAGEVTVPKWQLVAGPTPYRAAAARQRLCQHTDRHLQLTHSSVPTCYS